MLVKIRYNAAVAVTRQTKDWTAPHVDHCANRISSHYLEQRLLVPIGFVEEDHLAAQLLKRTEQVAIDRRVRGSMYGVPEESNDLAVNHRTRPESTRQQPLLS